MASKFAFKNMKANALLLTPFLIASSIMGTLFFVMASLGQNQYIEKKTTPREEWKAFFSERL